MTDRDSIFSPAQIRPQRAFTLVEVIVAMGILAFTVVVVVGLLATITRSGEEISARTQAVQLAEAIQMELVRLRDGPAVDVAHIRLDVLAENIPPGISRDALRLVGSPDGRRVTLESKADDPMTGLALRERYFLIEVRRQPGSLDYTSGAGFLATVAVVRWPYQLATGPGPLDARPADLAQASRVMLNLALTP